MFFLLLHKSECDDNLRSYQNARCQCDASHLLSILSFAPVEQHDHSNEGLRKYRTKTKVSFNQVHFTFIFRFPAGRKNVDFCCFLLSIYKSQRQEQVKYSSKTYKKIKYSFYITFYNIKKSRVHHSVVFLFYL